MGRVSVRIWTECRNDSVWLTYDAEGRDSIASLCERALSALNFEMEEGGLTSRVHGSLVLQNAIVQDTLRDNDEMDVFPRNWAGHHAKTLHKLRLVMVVSAAVLCTLGWAVGMFGGWYSSELDRYSGSRSVHAMEALQWLIQGAVWLPLIQACLTEQVSKATFVYVLIWTSLLALLTVSSISVLAMEIAALVDRPFGSSALRASVVSVIFLSLGLLAEIGLVISSSLSFFRFGPPKIEAKVRISPHLVRGLLGTTIIASIALLVSIVYVSIAAVSYQYIPLLFVNQLLVGCTIECPWTAFYVSTYAFCLLFWAAPTMYPLFRVFCDKSFSRAEHVFSGVVGLVYATLFAGLVGTIVAAVVSLPFTSFISFDFGAGLTIVCLMVVVCVTFGVITLCTRPLPGEYERVVNHGQESH